MLQTRQRPQIIFDDKKQPTTLFNGASFEGNNGDLHDKTHTLAFRFRQKSDDDDKAIASNVLLRNRSDGGHTFDPDGPESESEAESESGASSLTGVAAMAAPTMSVVGPGGSASSPVYGAAAAISVSTDAPWVRLDRTDGVAETGTGPDGDDSGRGWMTVADESVSFQGAGE